jgi:cytidylate kinase
VSVPICSSYIDASEEVRQSRRAAQGLVDSVRDRDRVDSSRANAPLMVADGAVVIDSDELSPNGVVDAILALMSANGFPVPVAP